MNREFIISTLFFTFQYFSTKFVSPERFHWSPGVRQQVEGEETGDNRRKSRKRSRTRREREKEEEEEEESQDKREEKRVDLTSPTPVTVCRQTSRD